ncbi:MAG: DnaD domain protein, partial [Anaerotruncus colihominis]
AMEQAADPPAQTNISSSAPGGPGPVPSVQTQAGENGQRIVTIAARPKIARDDVSEMAKNDDSIAQLLTLSQEILGAPLTPVESEILAALHSYYGLATDAVLMLLQYCVSTGHKSMHYVEKTAAAWLEKGISTYDQIEQEILRLTRNNDQEKKVIQAFGIYNRGLTSKERTYIEQWFAFGIDEKLIALACEKTLENTGKVSFAYADKILAAWKSKGISTVREAIDDSAAAKRSIPQNRSAQTGRDSSIDMDKIRAMLHRQLDG